MLRRAAYSDQCALRIFDHIAAMNEGSGSTRWADEGRCGACVPADDRRAAYLPVCDEARAACRGLHYRPRNASSPAAVWKCAQPNITYATLCE